MRSLLAIGIAIVLVLVFSYSYRYIEKLKTAKPSHYDQMLAFHLRQDQNLPEGLVYFIGDSHIQGLATQSVSRRSVNYGIGSDTTAGVLKRLSKYQSLKNAKAVVLGIGFNDLKERDNIQIISNIKKILDEIPNNICTITIDFNP